MIRGGELLENTLGDVDTLAVAVVEVEFLFKFLNPHRDSVKR